MSEIQVIKCLAAVAWGPNRPLSIEEVEVAPPGPGQVRIKVIATGVCHTDAHEISGAANYNLFPCILGHEGSGIVESIGEGVSSLVPGDHVVPVSFSQCRQCKMCKSPKSNLCERSKSLRTGKDADRSTPFTCKGQTVYQFMGCATFSQYTVVDEIAAAKINDAAPLEKVCLFGCGILTGYGAAVNTAKVEPGSTCAIWGLGGVGLAVAMGCKNNGAKRIIGIDINPKKFDFAKKFGVKEFLNPNDCEKPIHEVIADLTDGGCDYTFECVGNIAVMRSAIESCHNGWGICTIIGVTPATEEISTSTHNVLLGKTIKGSFLGGFKTLDAVPQLVNDYLNHEIMVDEFITHEKPLKDINTAFELMQEGKTIRTVILMQQ